MPTLPTVQCTAIINPLPFLPLCCRSFKKTIKFFSPSFITLMMATMLIVQIISVEKVENSRGLNFASILPHRGAASFPSHPHLQYIAHSIHPCFVRPLCVSFSCPHKKGNYLKSKNVVQKLNLTLDQTFPSHFIQDLLHQEIVQHLNVKFVSLACPRCSQVAGKI